MITSKDVIKIANLAHLEIREEEIERFTSQMNSILQFIEQLDQLDTSEVEPTSHAVVMNNALREDHDFSSEIQEKVFQAAPDHESTLFRVPKVLA